MSSKISALSAATGVAGLDNFTLVQGGVNKKVARDVILQAVDTEDVALTGFFGNDIRCGSVGNVVVTFFESATFEVQDTSGRTFIATDVFNNLDIGSGFTANLTLTGGLATITMHNIGGIDIASGDGTSVNITFLDPTPGNWAVAPPNDLAQAVIRIANAVVVLLGTPIP